MVDIESLSGDEFKLNMLFFTEYVATPIQFTRFCSKPRHQK